MATVNYYDNYVQKVNDRVELFELLANRFEIESALYPGSYKHITPSLFFPITVYVNPYEKAKEFFAKRDLINYIHKNKRYKRKPIIRFHNKDYRENLGEFDESFDLLISQYVGFISRDCKRYLKVGGLLLVNNTHGDASMAHLDHQFKLYGVFYKSNNQYYLTQKNLDKYFIPKKEIEITIEYLEKIKRGIGYKKTGSYYLFQRIK
jgi:hypothetical protein